MESRLGYSEGDHQASETVERRSQNSHWVHGGHPSRNRRSESSSRSERSQSTSCVLSVSKNTRLGKVLSRSPHQRFRARPARGRKQPRAATRARPAGRQGDAQGSPESAGRLTSVDPGPGAAEPRPSGLDPAHRAACLRGAPVTQSAQWDRGVAGASPLARAEAGHVTASGPAHPAARAVLLGVFAQPCGKPRGAAVDGRGRARAPGVPALRSRRRLRHSSYVKAAGSSPRGTRRGLLVRPASLYGFVRSAHSAPASEGGGGGEEGPAAGGTQGHTVNSGLKPGVTWGVIWGKPVCWVCLGCKDGW